MSVDLVAFGTSSGSLNGLIALAVVFEIICGIVAIRMDMSRVQRVVLLLLPIVIPGAGVLLALSQHEVDRDATQAAVESNYEVLIADFAIPRDGEVRPVFVREGSTLTKAELLRVGDELTLYRVDGSELTPWDES